MGADLYRTGHDEIYAQLKPSFDEAIAHRNAQPAGSAAESAAQATVDHLYDLIYPDSHYFRDNYNHTSLLWKLELSWWKDLTPFVDDDSVMHPDGCRAFRKEIADRAELLTYNIRDLPDDDPGHLDKRYFTDKFNRLLTFLQTAADAGDSISCSV